MPTAPMRADKPQMRFTCTLPADLYDRLMLAALADRRDRQSALIVAVEMYTRTVEQTYTVSYDTTANIRAARQSLPQETPSEALYDARSAPGEGQ